MGIEEEFDIEIPTEAAEQIVTVGGCGGADQERVELEKRGVSQESLGIALSI